MVLSVIPDFPQIPILSMDAVSPDFKTPIAVLTQDRQDEAELRLLARKLGPRLVVPEVWRDVLPQAGLLISSAISGGTLRERFLEAAAAAPRRCWLLLEPMRMEFPLPCPTGTGQSISAIDCRNVFYSEALCCQYTHFIRSGTGFMLLWDTDETLQRKLALAKSCGFLGFACQ